LTLESSSAGENLLPTLSTEVAPHIDAQPRTLPLLSLLDQLLDLGAAVLAILPHRHGLPLCHIAQLTSGIPYLLHRLLCLSPHWLPVKPD